MRHQYLAFLVLLLLPCAARANDWKPLLNGKDLAGWKAASGKEPGTGWAILPDGSLHRSAAAGDIVTENSYENFELEWEWKISAKGNGGVKYRVNEYGGAKNIGAEYQLLDDQGHSNGSEPTTTAGSIYQLAAPSPNKVLKPIGEWNQSRVVARGNHLEHWLNGVKIVDVTIGSESWKAALAKSKFKKADDFATKKGKVLIQDHGDEVWLRAMRIREIAATAGKS
jgi:Domain of Unknown Function (DUF1080)